MHTGNELKIIGECTHLISTTVRPTVYFAKCELLSETLHHLSDLEKQHTYAVNESYSPTQQLKDLECSMEEKNRQFLVRTYKRILTDIENLKTKQGKIKKFNNFIEGLKPYLDKLTAENQKQLAGIQADFQQKIYRW